LSVASAIFPNKNIVKQLPSLRFIQQMCPVLLRVTKTLAVFQLGGVSHFSQMFTDGTSRHTASFENLVIGYMIDNGYKCVTLPCILPEDGRAEACTQAILDTFKEGRMLSIWRNETQIMFPNRPDLVQQIPHTSELDIGKLYNGSIVTDTCDQAWKNDAYLLLQ
jgi:hypothetical protein